MYTQMPPQNNPPKNFAHAFSKSDPANKPEPCVKTICNKMNPPSQVTQTFVSLLKMESSAVDIDDWSKAIVDKSIVLGDCASAGKAHRKRSVSRNFFSTIGLLRILDC